MKSRLLLSILILFSISASTQNLQWAKRIGGTKTDIGCSIALDGSGNVYTTGNFFGTIDFDPGVGVYNLTADSQDVYISKLDASGNFLWAKKIGGPEIDHSISIAIDGSGNVYTTGNFKGTADFDPGVATFNLTSISYWGDMFISKLDASGNFVWAKSIEGGDTGAYINAMTVDGAGNVYTAGGFLGTVDFNPGVGVNNLTSAGSSDIFILKLDASGNFVWAKSIGGVLGDVGLSIAVDKSGNVYTTGCYWTTVDFDPGAGITNLTSQGSEDIFILKLDASGNFVWAKNMGGGFDNIGNAITVDGSGNVYIMGVFVGTSDFDPGAATFNLTSMGGNNTYNIFISKLDISGNFVWAKGVLGGYGRSNSIAVDGSGNVYTTGYFQGTVDLDPGVDTFNLSAVGAFDFFISKLDVSGNFAWAKSFGSTGWDIGNSLVVDGSGNVYTTGEFSSTVDFDPGAGTFNLTSAGDRDIFILKLGLYKAGINESSNKNLFSVYPNPAINKINIQTEASLIGSTYTVYDPLGKSVLTGKINSEKTIIELGGLSNGIYLLSVEGNAKQTFEVIQ